MQKKLFMAVALLVSSLSLLAQSGVLLLQKPTNSDTLSGGTVYTITWSSSNVDNIKIEYSLNDGGSWQTITASCAASALKYDWTVPVTPTSQGKVRIKDIDDTTLSSTSSGRFVIAQPQVRLLNVDRELKEGAIYAFNWKYASVARVDLHYSLDGGASYQLIRRNLPAAIGAFYWVPPALGSNMVHLRIRSVDDTTVIDTAAVTRILLQQLPASNPAKYRGGSYDGHSSATTMAPFIRFVFPAGGETFSVASSQTIAWQSAGMEQLQLHVSLDSGATWQQVESAAIASAQRTTWQVPNSPTSKGLLRLRSLDDTTLFVVLAQPFAIKPRSLQLQKSFETSYTEGQVVPVYWTNSGITSIKLQYRKAGSSQWITSRTFLPAALNGLLWVPPAGIGSDQVYLRIQDLADSTLADSSNIAFRFTSVVNTPAKYRGGSFDGHASMSNLPVVLQLLTPAPSAVLDGFTRTSINWKAQNLEQVQLTYSLDSMRTWQVLAPAVAANVQQFNFDVPGVPTSTLFFKIRASEDSTIIDTRGPFTIRGSYVQLFADTVALGNRQYMLPVQWAAAGIQKVNLHYRSNLDTIWQPIRRNLPAVLNQFIWSLPADMNGVYWMRIADTANTSKTDSVRITFQSAKSFTEAKYKGGSYDGHAMRTNTAKIQVTKPLPGEVVVAGTKYLITWNAQNVGDTVKIEYTTDNGLTWRTIQLAVDAKAGQYEWTLPSMDTLVKGPFTLPTKRKVPGMMGIAGKSETSGILTTLDNCRVRVSEAGRDADVEGLSNRTFIIASNRITPPATITATGGTQLCAGDSVTLTANPGIRYQWSNGATTPSVIVKQQGSFSVKVFYADSTNSTSESTHVTLLPMPKAVVQPSGLVSMFPSQPLLLHADTSAAYRYQWFKGVDSITGANLAQLQVGDSGTYRVRVALNGCKVFSAPVQVQVIAALPTNNLLIFVGDETCRTSNNGSISVKAQVNANYTATLKGAVGSINKEFSKEVKFENLEAGTYELCVMASALGYKQCFNLVVKEPQDLSVYSIVNPAIRIITLELNGSTQYNISINGRQLQTSSSQLVLPMQPGVNEVVITTLNACQGTIRKLFNASDVMLVTPNPASDELRIYPPVNVAGKNVITISDMQGRVVVRKACKTASDPVLFDIGSWPSGIYMVQLVTEHRTYQQKILKL